MEFHGKQKGRSPKKDFRRLKPFQGIGNKKVHLFFIYHANDQSTKDKLKFYLETGLAHYTGLYDYAGILFHTDESKMICFQDRDNPYTEIYDLFDHPAHPLVTDG